MSSSPISVTNDCRRPESVCELSKGATPPSASKLSVECRRIGASDTDSAAGDDALQPLQHHQLPSSQQRRSNPRRTSLQVMLPKLPSNESLNNSPGPASPGISNWADGNSLKVDGTSSDKQQSGDPSCKLTRKESYKAQRKTYRKEKKRVAHELLCSLQDPAVVVLADWLKVRGTLKSWTKLWCVLKPGLMLLYKSPKTKSNHWVGTVLLSSCQVIERPSKKDGFCFKLFHPMEQSIWASRGPDKETIGAVIQPLPTSYLIFRAPSQAAGKCWLDALELSLRCSALLVRSVSGGASGCEAIALEPRSEHETQWSEADYEKHFNDHGPFNLLSPTSPIFFPGTPDYTSKILLLHPNSHTSDTTVQNYPNLGSNQPKEYRMDRNMRKLESDVNLYALYKKYHEDKIALKLSKSMDYNRRVSKYYKSRSTGIKSDSEHECNRKKSQSAEEDYNKQIFKKMRRQQKVNGELLSAKSGFSSLDHSPMPHAKFKMKDLRYPYSSLDDSVPLRIYKRDLRLNLDIDCSGEFKDLDADSQLDGTIPGQLSGADSDTDSETGVADNDIDNEPPETPYLMNETEEFGNAGEQTEELPEEHKSLIWFLVKQVRPGMDLSKVVLPTFILEPRSFLDKLSDSYYHADYLSKAVQEDDAFTRMKTITQWYLSGLYKKPRGLKKPYNPILGETFRCYWQHPNGSRTFYIAEQVSHHPPVSAFYVTNRQDGFCISASILAKSKFYGNSTSAILDGTASLTLLPRGETYTLTVPYAHCKGILMGTLTMELGGKVAIECEKTGYRTEIEFKLKPFLGGAEQTNAISGRLKLGKETLSTIWGHWDGQINIKDSRTGEEQVLFNPTPETRASRLKRFTVAVESQGEYESERLWQHVSAAIYRDDQVAATDEKTVLEEAQRARTKERKATCSEWVPQLFQQDMVTGQWHYRHADLRPWDPRNDVIQYEYGYLIQTKTRHQTPMIRTTSIISVEHQAESRSSLAVLKSSRRALSNHGLSGSSSPEHDSMNLIDGPRKLRNRNNDERMLDILNNITSTLEKQTGSINRLQSSVESLRSIANQNRQMSIPLNTAVVAVICAIVISQILYWVVLRK